MTDFQLSFEFFPPRTEQGLENLRDACDVLGDLHPRFYSVTFGAGGSTRDLTCETVEDIRARTGTEVAPHISCVGSTTESIRELLLRYRDAGIRRLVALRGDLPSGMGTTPGTFRYANELVAFIRAETGDQFHIEVACYPEFHPQAASAAADLENFRRKVEAGADSAITQYFYNADAYFRFLDSLRTLGVEIAVVPGIMPITNFEQLVRFSDTCGAEIPRWIRRRLETYANDLQSLRKFGEEVTTELVRRLLEGGVPGLHFYTLNRAQPSARVWREVNAT
ncbi:MAG: methylenetetrahydrofolate reductase [NAD(P)H] [Gammaproteobacteria bacterium]|nr:methylenetetrahydrofolate reductase [NAD(P)H] [Gammaproteobacteria bacterium]